MADFHETTRQKLADLSSPNAAKRRDAAYWLGEAGVDESITRLRTMYDDPQEDPEVREAARYALGMFKAVKEALERGDEAKVVLLLRGIVDEGKFGRRRTTPASRLIMIVGVLFVVFLLLAGANFLVATGGGSFSLPIALNPEDAGTPSTAPNNAAPASNRDRATLLAAVRLTFDQVRADSTTLQMQFQAVLGGGALDCTAFFNNAAALVLSQNETAAHADLAALVGSINSARDSLQTGYRRYEQACFEEMPLAASEVGGVLAPVQAALNTLGDNEAALIQAETSGGAAEAATAAPALETVVTEAVATVVPTTDPQPYLQSLYPIVDAMSDPRGANGLLLQYWTDAFNAGVTTGCDTPPPDIPADYVLPQEAIGVPEAFTQAVVQVNIGLGLIRQGWDLFEQACSGGTLSQDATLGRQIAENATNAFSNANQLLASLQN
jgi:hypothetical protein